MVAVYAYTEFPMCCAVWANYYTRTCGVSSSGTNLHLSIDRAAIASAARKRRLPFFPRDQRQLVQEKYMCGSSLRGSGSWRGGGMSTDRLAHDEAARRRDALVVVLDRTGLGEAEPLVEGHSVVVVDLDVQVDVREVRELRH